MKVMSETLIQSKAMPKSIQNAPQAIMIMQAGYEMGMKPLQALQGLTIINGVITTHGKETIRRLRDHGWKIKYEEKENECTATVTKERESYTDTFKFSDAEKSKRTWSYRKDQNGSYVKDSNGFKKDLKPGWYEGENRTVKLRYGVISKILKTYIPEVLGSASEITEIAEDYPVDDIPTIVEKKADEGVIVSAQNDRPDLESFIANAKARKESLGKKEVKTEEVK